MSLTYVVGEGFKKLKDPLYTFEVSGEVELPDLTIIGNPRYNKDSFTISQAKIIAKVAGTAQYKVVVKSYGPLGGTEVTHIDQTVTLGNKTIVNLTISSATVDSNRSLELSLQSLTGTTSEDITVSLS